jgi:hypothetical protein
VNLTEKEITALANGSPWIYNPAHDCQVRFNADGTAEFSGILELDTLKNYAIARGYTEGDFNLVLDKVKTYAVIQNNMPIYIKGTCSVVNGNISFDVSQFKLGRLSVPVDQINKYKAELLDLAQQGMKHLPGFSVKNFSITKGQIHFEGTLPTTVKRVRE